MAETPDRVEPGSRNERCRVRFNDTGNRHISGRNRVTHGQPDHDSPAALGAPAIPTPTIGAGSADLRTASDDPVELQRLLELARERLAFYESFDRIIGENVRRSGELMLERISLREQVEARAASAARERAEQEARITESRSQYQGLLRDLMREVNTLRTSLDDMQARLQRAEDALGSDKEVESDSAPDGEPDSDPASPSLDDEEGDAPEEASPIPDRTATIAAMEAGGAAPPAAPEPASGPHPAAAREVWETSQVVELIAHGVPRAADALSLQRYLGGLDHVAGVEAREFAEGVLRLQITARTPISVDDIHGWPGNPTVRVLQHQPKVIEIDCAPA